MSGSHKSRSAQVSSSSTKLHQPLVALSPSEIYPLREAMRDLQLSVAEYYAATARGGELGRHVRSFLIAAQTINDLLTNKVLQSKSYKDLLATRHPAATLIQGVKFARNVVQHVLHVVRPSDELILVGGELGMRVYAVWDGIPLQVVNELRPATQRLEPAYQAELEGNEVTGTMMAVLRFYAEVAPEIVHRDSRGEWTGFPLLSQPGMNIPLHPEEPADLDESRQWMNSRKPGGDCRVVCGQVTVDGTTYVYGQTFVGRHSFAPFVESVDQANFDIGLGYAYLTGNIAANFDDVTDRFPEALQGVVLASRGDVLNWASPLPSIDCREDWHGPGVDAESWAKVVKMEIDPRLSSGFMFEPRRARRLNALVPPR